MGKTTPSMEVNHWGGLQSVQLFGAGTIFLVCVCITLNAMGSWSWQHKQQPLLTHCISGYLVGGLPSILEQAGAAALRDLLWHKGIVRACCQEHYTAQRGFHAECWQVQGLCVWKMMPWRQVLLQFPPSYCQQISSLLKSHSAINSQKRLLHVFWTSLTASGLIRHGYQTSSGIHPPNNRSDLSSGIWQLFNSCTATRNKLCYDKVI